MVDLDEIDLVASFDAGQAGLAGNTPQAFLLNNFSRNARGGNTKETARIDLGIGGFSVANAWIAERGSDGQSHKGEAQFWTTGVALADGGKSLYIDFYVNWGHDLPFVAMVFLA